jgi:hypothetical protein
VAALLNKLNPQATQAPEKKTREKVAEKVAGVRLSACHLDKWRCCRVLPSFQLCGAASTHPNDWIRKPAAKPAAAI